MPQTYNKAQLTAFPILPKDAFVIDRRQLFKKYYRWSLKNQDCDPALFLANYINTRMELNIEQRFWFAWLYANSYNLATAWVVANEFPDYENVNIETLTKWNTANYKRLRYQVDNKWQKGHLPIMFASYTKWVGSSQQEFFNNLLGATEQESFTNIYNFVVKNFYKFGRYLTWFYLQFLRATCDLPIMPPNLLLGDESSRSHCKGLLYVLDKEHWATDKKFKLTAEQIKYLDAEAATILQEMSDEYSDVSADYFSMETCLCAFKKIFRVEHGRYLGYYLDRQGEDIWRCQRDNWPGIDWQLLWDGRTENINNELLNVAVDKTRFGELIKFGKIAKIDQYV